MTYARTEFMFYVQLAMDIRHWLYIWRNCCRNYHALWGRNVNIVIKILPYLCFTFFLTRLYDRKLPNPHPIPRPTSNLTYRIQTLVGITGVRMVKYRPGWKECAIIWFKIIWRPHLVGVLLFEVRYMLPLIWHLLSATLGYALRFQYWYQCTPFYYK
jgi:hypothetical protein